MKVVAAPDSFKESLSARDVAEAIRRGVLRASPEAEVVAAPMADGGEGTVDALVATTNGRTVEREVLDPLGRRVRARFGMLGDSRTAVIEMAAASGLALVDPAERNVSASSTCGTGQLIAAALDEGAERIIIGIGGSATTDGGCGMARALGARLLDAEGRELAGTGADLSALHRIDIDPLDARVRGAELLVACDVENPLHGPRGAAFTYGLQKGASPEEVERLDRGLANFAAVVKRDLDLAVAELPGAGAAGGIGAGLVAFCGATLVPGIDLVMDAVKLSDKLAGAELVITGEGRIDATTAHGKTIAGVLRAARPTGATVVALGGSVDGSLDELRAMGLTACFAIVDGPMTLAEAKARTAELVEAAAERITRLFLAGRSLSA